MKPFFLIAFTLACLLAGLACAKRPARVVVPGAFVVPPAHVKAYAKAEAEAEKRRNVIRNDCPSHFPARLRDGSYVCIEIAKPVPRPAGRRVPFHEAAPPGETPAGK